ncbi:hypothetical protein VKT23_002755 [Stygiomarasmius scandens]|uniref:Uncharacterized protein n=1 Tax=Marasmiellus scandens TaxID=2682957 RepID=A0ABR1JZD6_9AGAR
MLQGRSHERQDGLACDSQLVLTQPIAGFVVSVKDGKVVSQGTVSDALVQNRALVAEAHQEEEELQIAEETIDATAPTADVSKSDGKPIVAEEVEIGHIGWDAMRIFFKALGGNHVLLFFLAYVGMIGLSEFAEIGQTWFLGHWAERYEKKSPEDFNVVYYLSIYGSFFFASNT